MCTDLLFITVDECAERMCPMNVTERDQLIAINERERWIKSTMLLSTLAEGNVSYQVIGTEKLKCVLIHYKSSGPQSEAQHSGWQIQPWGGREKNNDSAYDLSLWTNISWHSKCNDFTIILWVMRQYYFLAHSKKKKWKKWTWTGSFLGLSTLFEAPKI